MYIRYTMLSASLYSVNMTLIKSALRNLMIFLFPMSMVLFHMPNSSFIKKTAGDLSDSSVDLWRTLRVWLDAISQDNSLLTNTAFFLITTAAPAENSIVKELQSETPSYEKIYSTLENIANTSKNQTTAKARESFLKHDKGEC